jgi:hypothetical protein
MPTLRRPATALAVLLSLTALAGVNPPRAEAGPGGCHYAAIAYSEQTGRFGYAYGRTCLADARAAALANCHAPGARVVACVENGWVALARGVHGAYGYGWSTRSLGEAEAIALRGCASRGSPGVIAVWASSS